MQFYKKTWLNRNLIGFSLASFFNDLSYEMLTATLPAFFTQLAGPTAPLFLGIMGGLSEAFANSTKLIAGIMSDRINIRKPFIAAGYGIGTLFNAFIPLSHSAWHVVFFQTLSRLGKGIREPARDALLAASVDPMYYGRSFGFNRAMDTLGAVLGPLIIFILLARENIRSLLLFAIIPGVLAVLCIIIFVQDIPSQSKNVDSLVRLWRSLPRSFVIFLIVFFIFGCGRFHVTLLILRAQEILQTQTTLSLAQEWSIGLYIFFNIIQAISEYTLGRISDIGGRKYLLGIMGFTVFGLSCLLLALSTTLTGTTIAFILAAIAIAATGPLSKAYAAELLPAHARGLGYGALQAVDGSAKLIAGFIIGLLWTKISPTISFSYAAITSFLATIFLLFHKK